MIEPQYAQEISIPMIMIIGAVVTLIVGVVGTIMMGLISVISAVAWWSFNRWVSTNDKEREEAKLEREKQEIVYRQEINSVLSQMKSDREAVVAKVDSDKRNFDERLERAAELFGTQVAKVGQEFMSEMKEVKATISNLSQTISNLVSAHTNNEKRMDQQHTRIEEVSKRGHDTDENLQALAGKVAVNAQRLEDKQRENEIIREASTKRLEMVERIVGTQLEEERITAVSPRKRKKRKRSTLPDQG